MNGTPNALQILLEEQERNYPSVPEELIKEIYQIELRVQFDEARQEAPHRIRQAIKRILDKEALEGESDGDVV